MTTSEKVEAYLATVKPIPNDIPKPVCVWTDIQRKGI